MNIVRLVSVCPPFARALDAYDRAFSKNEDGEALDILWKRVVGAAAAFRRGETPQAEAGE